ncbi:PD-(D/E)XK nuclease family protein [Gammaproteobacteria bacterium]|nr:PD-(D/E)XK nuclease family protein [Gammaproteobacteria bacterium]
MHDRPTLKPDVIICSSIQVKHALIHKYYQKTHPKIVTTNQYIHQLFDFAIADAKPLWISESEAKAILVTQLSSNNQIPLIANRLSITSNLIMNLNHIIYSHPITNLDQLKQLLDQELSESNSKLLIKFLDFCTTNNVVNQSLSLLWLASQKAFLPNHLKYVQLCGSFDKDVLFLSILPLLKIKSHAQIISTKSGKKSSITTYNQSSSEIESVAKRVCLQTNTQNSIAIITNTHTQALQIEERIQGYCIASQNDDMLTFNHWQQSLLNNPLARAIYTSTIPLDQLLKGQLVWLAHTWHANQELKYSLQLWSNRCSSQLSAESWIKRYRGSDSNIQNFFEGLSQWHQEYENLQLKPSDWLKAWKQLWLECYLWMPDGQLIDKKQNNIHQKLIGIFDHWSRIDQWIQPLSMENACLWLKQLIDQSSQLSTNNHPSRINIISYQMVADFPKLFFDQIYATTITRLSLPSNQPADDTLELIDAICEIGENIHFSDTQPNFYADHKTYNKLATLSTITSHPNESMKKVPLKTIKGNDLYVDAHCPQEPIKITPYQLEMHLQCPLKAYLTFQAKLSPAHDPIVEESMIRGQSLHEILALFWTEIRTWQSLQQCTRKSIEDLLKQLTQQVVNKQAIKQKRLAYFDHQAESICLQARVNQWIDYELNRQPFKVVAIEKTYQRHLNDLHVVGRVDRIDELANGCWLLIDYKLSKTSLTNCLPPEMTACQLPVYRWLINNENLAGFGYGHLLLDKPNLVAIGDVQKIDWVKDTQKLASISWDDYGIIWQNYFNDLSQSIVKQLAPQPNPISPQVCGSCPFHIQCPKQQGQQTC